MMRHFTRGYDTKSKVCDAWQENILLPHLYVNVQMWFFKPRLCKGMKDLVIF